jgi:glutaredoxin
MVKVFASHTCPYCEKLERYFDSIQVSFHIIFIDEDHKALQEVINLTGSAGVPVTLFENGEYVLGFDREKIDEQLAAQGEILNDPGIPATRGIKIKVIRNVKDA